ncbi:unnamed protein product [Symbiodinium sp. CCMP2592]|nr:unnamed protein product [Symbiodinium sp. CCMP2592]
MSATSTKMSLRRRRSSRGSSRSMETLWMCGSPDSQQDSLSSLMTRTRMH